jgi:uncharacterized UBP type Zn finger protein
VYRARRNRGPAERLDMPGETSDVVVGPDCRLRLTGAKSSVAACGIMTDVHRMAWKDHHMPCTHGDQILVETPNSEGCEECLALGDTWVNLRVCLTCGNVGCCDASKNKHATRHFQATGHPIMQSMKPGETWRWCYIDEVMLT